MSVLPLKADIRKRQSHVRFVPQAEIGRTVAISGSPRLIEPGLDGTIEAEDRAPALASLTAGASGPNHMSTDPSPSGVGRSVEPMEF